MDTSNTETKIIPLKVWLPLGKVIKVSTIVSTLHHLGNNVAEGRLHPSMFWPELARYKSLEAKRNLTKYLQLYDELERKSYSSSWIDRWLQYEDEDQ